MQGEYWKQIWNVDSEKRAGQILGLKHEQKRDLNIIDQKKVIKNQPIHLVLHQQQQVRAEEAINYRL